jgi:hypothetical protein
MRPSRSPRALLTSRRRAGILAAAIAPALAACNGTAAPVSLPPRSPSATPALSSTPAPLSAQQQVIAAFTGYVEALGQAEKSRNAIEARELLRPYLASSRIAATVQTMSSFWASGEIFYGQDVLHIMSVSLKGATALVHDCDDTSGMGLENAATGRVVPGSAGIQHLNLVTRLDLVGGRWLVQVQVIEDVPCAA